MCSAANPEQAVPAATSAVVLVCAPCWLCGCVRRRLFAIRMVSDPLARSSSPLLALPVELQALIAHHLSGPSFTSLRLASRQVADAAGRYCADRLCGAAATYGSAAFSKALPHDELASWPVRSGALAVLLPLEQWAATLSAASPLLELWLRHELPAHYLQLLRALGRSSEPFFFSRYSRSEQRGALAARAALRHLHIRALLRHGAPTALLYIPRGGRRAEPATRVIAHDIRIFRPGQVHPTSSRMKRCAARARRRPPYSSPISPLYLA